MNNVNLFSHWKRRYGDRYDGWRLRNVDPYFRVLPFVMKNRLDSQNLYETELDLDVIEDFIKEHKTDMPELSIMHVILASLVRTISQKPRLNRFIVWNKLFARNQICFSLIVKRSLTESGEETLTKTYFDPNDTLADVVKKIQTEVHINLVEGAENDTDATSKVLGSLPPFLLRLVVQLLYVMDNLGILPKAIHQVSPWHCSLFVTNIGSIGLDSLYHHLNRFGTCSMFVAMGKKKQEYRLNQEGKAIARKYLSVKFTMDERICDGFYYASSLRYLNKQLANPKLLLTPPETLVWDDGI